MKRNFTSLPTFFQLMGKVALTVLMIMLFSLSGHSQMTGTAKDLGDLSGIQWKATADFGSAVADEHAKMALALSSPALGEDEKALFNAYDRLLNYVMADVQAGKAVDTAIKENYEKVLSEVKTGDPLIKAMPLDLLSTFVPGLVESLTATQVLIPINAN